MSYSLVFYMDDVIAKLRNALAETKISVAGATSITFFGIEVIGSQISKDAALKMLQNDEELLRQLANENYRAVLSGVMSIDRWTEKANVVGQDIRYNGGLVGEFSAKGVIASTAAATGSDIKAITTDTLAAIDAPLTKYAVIIIVALFLILAIKLSFIAK
jgi:hypothetical protein